MEAKRVIESSHNLALSMLGLGLFLGVVVTLLLAEFGTSLFFRATWGLVKKALWLVCCGLGLCLWCLVVVLMWLTDKLE